jgi:hypothetical protein
MFMMFLSVLLLLEFFGRTVVLTKAEEYLWSGSGTKPRLMKYFDRPLWRFLWLNFLVLDISIFLRSGLIHSRYWFLEFVVSVFFSFGLNIFYYFVAVDPLPPGKSKMRVWIESFTHGKLVPVKVDL